uniref:Uncharacterized protein n=1 Tax=Arundo donax TaxID=35708 RepID=A0A0A9E5Q8_ARUDO
MQRQHREVLDARLLKPKAFRRNRQVQLFNVIRKGKFKGQNWMMEVAGSLHSVSAKVAAAVEVAEAAATTLVDSFSSPSCCS